MKRNEIEEMLENIITDYSTVSLNPDESNSLFEEEVSYLYKDGNGKIVWDRSLGSCPDIYCVSELDENDLEILLELLLYNGIISKNIHDYLLDGEDD